MCQIFGYNIRSYEGKFENLAGLTTGMKMFPTVSQPSAEKTVHLSESRTAHHSPHQMSDINLGRISFCYIQAKYICQEDQFWLST